MQLYGEKGEKVVANELTQLHTMEACRAVDAMKMAMKERAKVLLSLMFLVGKRSGDIKAFTIADGSK